MKNDDILLLQDRRSVWRWVRIVSAMEKKRKPRKNQRRFALRTTTIWTNP